MFSFEEKEEDPYKYFIEAKKPQVKEPITKKPQIKELTTKKEQDKETTTSTKEQDKQSPLEIQFEKEKWKLERIDIDFYWFDIERRLMEYIDWEYNSYHGSRLRLEKEGISISDIEMILKYLKVTTKRHLEHIKNKLTPLQYIFFLNTCVESGDYNSCFVKRMYDSPLLLQRYMEIIEGGYKRMVEIMIQKIKK